jgi:ubiquitin-protein ligase E3 C
MEMGIDAGGLFKEFWTTLSAEAFNPSYGLFKLTEEQTLYPNPDSEIYCGPEHTRLFYTIGRVLGKAIYEGLVVDPTFSEFFLRKMLGQMNFAGDIYSLDRELYNSL